MAVQWVHLGDQLLVASGRGAQIGRPDLGSIAFAEAMTDAVPADLDSTRHLLDGAIAAAERITPERVPEVMTAHRWAWQLAAQWYSAHHSIALMPAAAERYRRDHRPELAGFAERKLADERDHDQLPLADLRAHGYDADALVRAVRPDPAVVAGVEYARMTITGEQPAEFIGYMYALERRMARIPEAWFEELERALDAGRRATAGLRSHATALDVGHVEEALEFIATLPAADRTSIAIGAHRITEIRCAGLTGPQPSEDELRAWLAPFAGGVPAGRELRNPQMTGERA